MRLRRTVTGVALTTLSAGLLATIPLTAAQAVSADLVISQVYGAGGNSGAVYNADYIEIYNRGTAAAPLNGLSLQYGSAAGNIGSGITELPNVSIPAGAYFLVQEGSGTNGSAFTADFVDPTPIAMAAGAGKVALVRGTTSLNCATATACTPVAARIVDLVGYGTGTSGASYYEGSGAVPTLNATTAAFRKDNGRVDSDDNAADFTTATPAPRNSGPVVEPPAEPEPELVPIAEVQGSGATSPLKGDKVIVEGVVVGDLQAPGQFGGFFVQSVTPDADPATSDGIRVFDNAAAVAVGDLVTVTGTVEEFASSGLYTGSETQLGSVSVENAGPGTLPEPAVLQLPFAPTTNGVTGQERYEGMRVTVPGGLIATDLYTLGQYGEVSLTTGELLRVPTSAAEAAANDADRITLDDGLSGQYLEPMPYTIDEAGTRLPRAGDALAEEVTGVFSYSFGEYRVEPSVGTTAGFTSNNPRTDAPDAVGGDVQVAVFNVLNYFTDLAPTYQSPARGANTAEELVRQQDKLVSAITALDADVVGLIEIANDDGDALRTLVGALNDAQPGTADDYTAVQAPALNEPTALGGTYGTDAIRTAIIYRATVVSPAGPPPSDEALLDPADPAFPGESLFDRPPAVQAFAPVVPGREFTVVVNHLKSKGSTNAQCGRPDDFGGNCDDLRERQAAGIVDLLDELGADDSLLLGDFNSYEAEAPIAVLKDAGFVSAAAKLPTSDRYTYSFDGEFGTLDYVFASPSLAGSLTGADIWHINSAESPANDYNQVLVDSQNRTFPVNQDSLYAPDAFSSSDHDPEIVGLELSRPTVADAGGPYTTRVDRNVVLDASKSSDPDTDTLTYAWDLDGDGAFDDATGVTVAFGVDLPPGYYPVAVRVTDGDTSDVDDALVTITTPNGKMPPGRR